MALFNPSDIDKYRELDSSLQELRSRQVSADLHSWLSTVPGPVGVVSKVLRSLSC